MWLDHGDGPGTGNAIRTAKTDTADFSTTGTSHQGGGEYSDGLVAYCRKQGIAYDDLLKMVAVNCIDFNLHRVLGTKGLTPGMKDCRAKMVKEDDASTPSPPDIL